MKRMKKRKRTQRTQTDNISVLEILVRTRPGKSDRESISDGIILSLNQKTNVVVQNEDGGQITIQYREILRKYENEMSHSEPLESDV